MTVSGRQRLRQLLVDRATEGLDPAGQTELERLAALHPDEDLEAYDRLMALLDLALAPPEQALPAGLRSRLERSAQRRASP